VRAGFAEREAAGSWPSLRHVAARVDGIRLAARVDGGRLAHGVEGFGLGGGLEHIDAVVAARYGDGTGEERRAQRFAERPSRHQSTPERPSPRLSAAPEGPVTALRASRARAARSGAPPKTSAEKRKAGPIETQS